MADQGFADLRHGHDPLRALALRALQACRAMWMGPNAVSGKELESFSPEGPIHIARAGFAPDAGERPQAPAERACRLLLACQGADAVRLDGEAWRGIVREAELAVPGYREAVSGERRRFDATPRLGVDGAAVVLAADVVYVDAIHGFPSPGALQDLVAGAAQAVGVPSAALG